MSHMVAAIDVHKKMLAVVVADASEELETPFLHKKFGTQPKDLQEMVKWFTELQVKEVVMESTAQYGKPVWGALQDANIHVELAQARSNLGRKGRKSDFGDAERLWRRYDADELILSFVPDPEPQIWRTQSRTRVRLARDKSRIQARTEALLEEMRIKLSSVVSDLFGVSARRMLEAIAAGEREVEKLAEMADPNLRATQAQLCDALKRVKELDPRHRALLQILLDQLEWNEKQSQELLEALGKSLEPHQDVVERVAEIPGMGIDSALQVIAEIGPKAETFASAGELASWVGICPGKNESAEENSRDRSPKGNVYMRRILTQTGNAAAQSKGTVLEARYQRIRGRDAKKHNTAIWAVGHHQLRVIHKVVRDGVRYEERGGKRNPQAAHRRANRLKRELRALGYEVSCKAPTANDAIPQVTPAAKTTKPKSRKTSTPEARA
jgi:transposase